MKAPVFAAVAVMAALVALTMVAIGGRGKKTELIAWQNLGPLVTACSKGNNAACDKLAANPNAMSTLQKANRANGMAGKGKSSNSWWGSLGLKGAARQQALYQVGGGARRGVRTQSLSDFMGEHWLVEGVDNLPKDKSSGNSLFDFGIYDGTPVEPATGSPLQGTLSDQYIQPMVMRERSMKGDRPWQFDRDAIRASEDHIGQEYAPEMPKEERTIYGPRVDVEDGHYVAITDGGMPME